MSDWKSIETAPKDGPILGYGYYMYHGDTDRTEYIEIIEWNEEKGKYTDYELYGIWTHWMPLPEPPK